MIDKWNIHMSLNWRSGLFECLDESMSIWYNKFTCPGWMFVPRKPHPFGNEYHSKGCVKAKVINHIDLVERKDKPATYWHMQTNILGKTIGLLK